MTVETIIRDLTGRGVTLRADGDALRVSPKSALTPDDVVLLREQKADILRALDARLCRLQAEYGHALARWSKAEAYFADPTVPDCEKRRHAPSVDELSEEIGRLTLEINAALGRKMTREELLQGFRRLEGTIDESTRN